MVSNRDIALEQAEMEMQEALELDQYKIDCKHSEQCIQEQLWLMETGAL